MNKKFLSVLIAAIIMVCTLFSGCSVFEDIFGGKQPTVEKVQITIDSNPNPTLNKGDTYKLLYTCAEQVTVTCNGKFNYNTNIFTADKAGKFEIKLSAGKDEAYNEVTVNITVIAPGDKSALEELVNSTESYIESDYYNFKSLTDELVESRKVLANGNATQNEIDVAVTTLQAVINGLRPKAFGDKKAQINDNYILYDGKYYHKTYYTNFTTVANKIKTVNSDTSIKLNSVYDSKITSELKKLTGINGKELATMNIQRGTEMALAVFNGYYKDSPDGLDVFSKGTGAIVYDVLDTNGNHIKNEGTGNKETDFWTLTSLFGLMVRLDEVNTTTSYKAQVDKVIDAMSYHRGTRSDNTVDENGNPKSYNVYGVHRSNNKNGMNVSGYLGRESVFDDQIWAAQEFLNAYNLYKDAKYLDYAVELTEYIYINGRCERGGIYWGQGYTTRHACSSAPFVKLAVMLKDATGKTKYLDWAKDVYDWTYKTLRDTSDNLYYDLIGTTFQIDSPVPDSDPAWQNPKYIEGNKITGDGNIDRKKYSYNSGSMVSAGVALYNATGEKHYLDEAKATAKSCRSYFGKKNADGYIVYPGSDGNTTYSWFDLILYKGYYDLYSVDKTAGEYLDDVQKVYDFNCANYYNNGFIPVTGVDGWTDGRNSYNYRVLMDHATNAEVMLLLGQYKNI